MLNLRHPVSFCAEPKIASLHALLRMFEQFNAHELSRLEWTFTAQIYKQMDIRCIVWWQTSVQVATRQYMHVQVSLVALLMHVATQQLLCSYY